ncbi:MAG: hypothetical protein JO129_02375 [Candidatus Dependentiae bacterium]|nr:hypothetical protein [Candidatus Dependentiae bacterium]
MKKNILCFVLILFAMAGCGNKQKIKPTEFLQQQEIIAKCTDLPDAPFQVQLKKIVSSSENCDQFQLFYTFSIPQQDLITFYQQQMERLGWELFAESNLQDYLLHFTKPDQICSILIKDSNLSIYICKKEGA